MTSNKYSFVKKHNKLTVQTEPEITISMDFSVVKLKNVFLREKMPRYITTAESQTMWSDLSPACLQQKSLHIHIWRVKIRL